jgi:DNA invertase Pin-like site-specific DNA recombinase
MTEDAIGAKLAEWGLTLSEAAVLTANGPAVAAYLRRSKEEQEDSIARQWGLVLPHLLRSGYRLVAVYIDDERGWKLSRTDFRRLLADAQAGAFTLVVMDEPSRLSRSRPLEFMGEVAYPLQKAGVQAESVSKGRVNWDEIGDFITGAVHQFQAAAESEDLGRRVATGLLNLAKDGRLHAGAPAFGYRSLTRRESRRGTVRVVRCGLEPCERLAPVVQWMFEQAAAGTSTRALARELTSRGVLPPRGRRSKGQERKATWDPRSVARILRNEVYCGDYIWGKTKAGAFWTHQNGRAVPAERPRGGKVRVVATPKADWTVREGQHPALVSRDLFEAVQARLRVNKRRTHPKGEQGNDYPLSGLLVCSRCGSAMTGMSLARLKGEYRRRYVCRGWRRYGKSYCRAFKVLEGPLVRLLVKKLREAYLDAGTGLLSDLRAEARRRAEGVPEERGRLEGQVRALDGQIQRAEGNLALCTDADDFRAVSGALKRLRAERAAAAEGLARLGQGDEAQDVERQIRRLEGLLWNLAEVAQQAEPVLLRRVLTELVEQVELEFSAEPGPGQAYKLLRGVITVRCPEPVTSPR